MIAAAIFLLVAALAYVTLRLRELDQWVQELSKSVAQDASALLRLELEQAKYRGGHDGIVIRLANLADNVSDVNMRMYPLEDALFPYSPVQVDKPAKKKPAKRGKK